ncbi:MAG: copper oxidase (laccase) domain-containing protein [Verrucomicrobiales bacterium]|jgi:copper oxidase (laccase) domain-containing protein
MKPSPLERFPHLESRVPWASHAFIQRVPGISVDVERAEAMVVLKPSHLAAVEALGFAADSLWTAEQVHDNKVTIVPDLSEVAAGGRMIAGADGLITRSRGCLLGIYVADCGPIYVADTRNRAIAVLHSGRKGTERNILAKCLERMDANFSTSPEDVVVQLGPCIRPPAYEVDFAAQILTQAEKLGIPSAQIFDCGTCTARNLERYYSYRVEKGKTGRMMALFGIS